MRTHLHPLRLQVTVGVLILTTLFLVIVGRLFVNYYTGYKCAARGRAGRTFMHRLAGLLHLTAAATRLPYEYDLSCTAGLPNDACSTFQ